MSAAAQGPFVSRWRGLWPRWVAMLDRTEPATHLAIVRILVAVVLLSDLLLATQHQVVEALWSAPRDGGMAYGLEASWWASQWEDSRAVARWLHAATCGAAIMFGIGLATRTSGILLVLLYAQLALFLPEADRGIDNLFRWTVLLLVCSRSNVTLSVDAYLTHGRLWRPHVMVPAWPRLMIILQLVWMYFSAALHKTQSPWTPWGGYTALWYVLQDPHFARFDPSWLKSVVPLTRLATFATTAFELTAPLVLLNRWRDPYHAESRRFARFLDRIRFFPLWITLGFTFHVALLFTLRLGIFPIGVLALYPALFHPHELSASLEAGRTWMRSRSFGPRLTD